MAEIRLTDAQRTAVENRGGSLLVSAAAGSGKTKVLVERLFAHMEQGANIDEFLIITYTKAAAAELRGKIAAEIAKRVAAQPDNAHLRRQMFRVYQADIRTVDGFCTAVLRQNAHLLQPIKEYSYTPDFRILDEQEAELLKQRVLQRVLEEFYRHMDEQDELLAETLGAGREDRTLEELVLELHEKVQSHPYPQKWLDEVEKQWQIVETKPYLSVLLEGVKRKTAFWAMLLRKTIARMAEDEKLYTAYGEAFLAVAEQLERFAACEDWSAMTTLSLEFPRLKPVKGDDARKEQVKRIWTNCKDAMKKVTALFAVSEAEYGEDLAAMAPAMRALVRLTGEFSDAYQLEKARRNVMDFSDEEHYAIALLTKEDGTPSEAAQQIAEQYREIMVDEYQDSNAVQESIFAAVSQQGRNLFAVGDVKQSIYRFRLADPGIFLEKYLTYRDAAQAGDGEARRVLLSQNFRSRREVLDATNFVFRSVMSREMGELDYGEDEQLYFGAEYYLPRSDTATEFHLVSVVDTDEERFDRTKTEAQFVAQRIQKMLREGYPVQDGDTLRPCRPEDFAILMRSPKSRLKAFTAALRHLDIPCSTAESGGFFDTVEIAVIWSFLQIIDNPRQDVPLISVLRSPLFGFTADKLAEIRALQKDGDFYEALLLDEGEETARFLAVLQQLRQAAKEESAETVLWHLYDLTGAMAVFGAMQDGEERRNNLLAFYAYAQQMGANEKKSLFEFTGHLRRLLEEGHAPDLSTQPGGSGVQILSIHKSKGLEYPIVILCDLHKAFNREDLKRPVLVHSKLGLGTERVETERHIRYDTVSKLALARQLERETKAEELRLLYVAMTRAKEKLILVQCMKKAQKHLQDLAAVSSCPISPEAVSDARCMGDWVLLPLLQTPEAECLRRYAGIETVDTVPSDGGWQVFAEENPVAEERETDGAVRELAAREDLDTAPLNWRYAHQEATAVPSKVTATALKGRELDEEVRGDTAVMPAAPAFRQPKFIRKAEGLSPTERGTAVHLVMQYLDFRTPPENGAVEQVIAGLVSRHLMTPEQSQAVEPRLIADFLASPLCRRLCDAEKLYREYRFDLLVDAAICDRDAAGEEIMLQGVVDCAFETPEGLVIVDFKTDRVTPQEMAARAEHYRPQLEAYATALGRVLQKPVREKILYFFHTKSAVNL